MEKMKKVFMEMLEEGLEEQITRDPFPSPSLEITDKPFWDLKFEDFTLKNYEYHPVIKFPVAV